MNTEQNLYNKVSENAYVEVIYKTQIHKQQQNTLQNRETWTLHTSKHNNKRKETK